jgi:lipopolysaccharide/colanic/teichoic acid biosynthesis glycosyltransferase
MLADSAISEALTDQVGSASQARPEAATTPSRLATESGVTRGDSGPARPRRGWYIPLKMAIDWTIAAILFIPLAPLIGFLILLVRITSPGPGLYKQKRLGRFGKPYMMYKIRSMTHNCEAKSGVVWSGPNDSRVTRIGRFLRDAHLDELPQLFNVLRCEMSLIGPRPERPELVEKIRRQLPRYPERMEVRPGLTGFAQIQHPADLDLDHVRRKLMYDLYYVKEVGPLLDVRILLGTALYICGTTFKALGKLLVKGHGEAAEREHEDLELLELERSDDAPLRATGS